MALISDTHQYKKLKDYNINIKTRYIVGNDILERNTDNSKNDDIDNGIRCEKIYYKDNKIIHTENLFDSRIEYTFISEKEENENYKCPNCGMEGIVKEFLDGCPYCRTYYNVDYTNKELSSKHHYDLVLRKNTYRIVTFIVDLIISILVSFIFIKATSRTFNEYDISKIFIYGTILSLILYYFFYLIDGYIVLAPIKNYKNKLNQKQIDFWNRTKINKKNFFNNLNYEVRKYYYQDKNIIDYDIIDYLDFKEYEKDNHLYVDVIADVRVVYYISGKIKSKIISDKYTLMHYDKEILELKDGINYIKCPHCGSSIDATKGMCNYCHKEINYLQEWILKK